MKILFIVAIAVIVFGVFNYDKMSYKQWCKRCKERAEYDCWKM